MSSQAQIRPRGSFLRSVRIERDFTDRDILSSIVVSKEFVDLTERIIKGLRPESKSRAFRLVGDYGSGKSTFALFLAHLFGSKDAQTLPEHIQEALQTLGDISRPALLPVLVTGERRQLGQAIHDGLSWALDVHGLESVRKSKSKCSRSCLCNNPSCKGCQKGGFIRARSPVFNFGNTCANSGKAFQLEK